MGRGQRKEKTIILHDKIVKLLIHVEPCTVHVYVYVIPPCEVYIDYILPEPEGSI